MKKYLCLVLAVMLPAISFADISGTFTCKHVIKTRRWCINQLFFSQYGNLVMILGGLRLLSGEVFINDGRFLA